MPVKDTKSGRFTLNAATNVRPREPGDTGVSYGASFDVEFAPAKLKNKIGLIQLIRAQTNVGAYETNKTDSGWAVDKQSAEAASASSVTYKLTYGITGDRLRPGLQHRFGENGSPAHTYDTPQEILGVSSPKIGHSTKFVHYVADLTQNKILDEGVIWGYSTNGATAQVLDLQVVRLSEVVEHRQAMEKFLGLAGTKIDISKLIMK